MSFAATSFDPSSKNANVTLSNSNLTAAMSGTGRAVATRPIMGLTYFEITVTNATSARIGFTPPYNYDYTSSNALGADYASLGYDSGGSVYYAGSSLSTIASFSAGAVICVAINPILGLVWFRVNNGNWNNASSSSQNPVGNVGGISLATAILGQGGFGLCAFWPAVSGGNAANFTAAFTSGSWTYSAPTGYGAIGASLAAANNPKPEQNYTKASTVPTWHAVEPHPATKRGGKCYTAGNAGSLLGVGVSISGNIQESGSNVARTVFVFDNTTGEILEKVKSDPTTGNFSALCHSRSQVIALALDPTSFQAQVYDRLTPA